MSLPGPGWDDETALTVRRAISPGSEACGRMLTAHIIAPLSRSLSLSLAGFAKMPFSVWEA